MDSAKRQLVLAGNRYTDTKLKWVSVRRAIRQVKEKEGRRVGEGDRHLVGQL